MSTETNAEIFIQTLTELWQEECQRKKARLRLQMKESVKRFVEEFQAEPGNSRHRPTRTVQTTRKALPARWQIHGA